MEPKPCWLRFKASAHRQSLSTTSCMSILVCTLSDPSGPLTSLFNPTVCNVGKHQPTGKMGSYNTYCRCASHEVITGVSSLF